MIFGYSINDVVIKYEKGEYRSAIDVGEKLLEKMKGDITDEDAKNLQTYIAFSYVAIGDTINAQKFFENILMIDKNYSLNEEFVSPKIIKVFKKAKDRINLLIKDLPNYYTSNNKNILNISKTNLLIKSAILPGWGQYTIKEKEKATILTSVFSVAGISTIISFIAMLDARDRYVNSTNTDDAISSYNSYNNFSKINRISFDIMLSTYLFNLWDIVWIK